MSGCNLDIGNVDKIIVVTRSIGAERTRSFVSVMKRRQDSFVQRAR